MLSGRRLDLLEPSPLDVEIDDIAHGLARVARWNGQTHGRHAFSVAQHSVIVWQIFRKLFPRSTADEELLALLHDGPEYVIGDMISPFKAVLGGEYEGVETRLQEAIHLRYSLPAKTPDKLKANIKRADTVSAYFEATELAGFNQTEARKLFGTPRGFTLKEIGIQPLSASAAQKLFLDAFATIERKRKNND
ncbi:MAG: HD family hydrolase [Rhizobiaceae bacterium]|nr:HD family hydrolase [Rhizobiaceae bacterium]